MSKTIVSIPAKIAFKAWRTRFANKKRASRVARKAWITRKHK